MARKFLGKAMVKDSSKAEIKNTYVNKSNIVFFLNHKNENEVVYVPDSEKIEYVSPDEIEEIPTINSPRNKRIAKGEL